MFLSQLSKRRQIPEEWVAVQDYWSRWGKPKGKDRCVIFTYGQAHWVSSGEQKFWVQSDPGVSFPEEWEACEPKWQSRTDPEVGAVWRYPFMCHVYFWGKTRCTYQLAVSLLWRLVIRSKLASTEGNISASIVETIFLKWKYSSYFSYGWCCGLMSHKMTSVSPNPWCLWVEPYLEMRSLQM